MTGFEFLIDGPHSPEYTRQLGEAMAESVRCLNYATLGDAPGLEYPRDADRLLRDVVIALDRLPQLLGQVRRWLDAQTAAGAVGHDQGHDASRFVSTAGGALVHAAEYLAAASDALRAASADTSHLTGLGGTDE